MDYALAEQYARETLRDYGIKPTNIRVEIMTAAYVWSRGGDPTYWLGYIARNPDETMDNPRDAERIARVARELQELLAHAW